MVLLREHSKKGCSTCKRRKIKCDERRPICLHCEKSGRLCFGMDSNFINHGTDLMVLSSEAVDEAGVLRGQFCKWKLKSAPKVLPLSHDEKLSRFLAAAAIDIDRPGLSLNILGKYFEELPRRIGHNAALDAVAGCMAFSHQNISQPSTRNRQTHLIKYSRALRAVEKEFASKPPEELRSEELLLAIVVLSNNEYLSPYAGDEPAWMQHIGGVEAMIRALGPNWFKTDFAYEIFHETLDQTIPGSVLSGRPCLLAEQEWSELLERRGLGSSDPHRVWDSTVFQVYGQLPEILRQVRSKSVASEGLVGLVKRCTEFRRETLRIFWDAERKIGDPKFATEQDSTRGDIPYRRRYTFANVEVMNCFVYVWRLTMVSDQILRKLTGSAISPETFRATENLGMTWEYALERKPFGAFFHLPAALMVSEFCTEEEKEWLSLALQEGADSVGPRAKYFTEQYMRFFWV